MALPVVLALLSALWPSQPSPSLTSHPLSEDEAETLIACRDLGSSEEVAKEVTLTKSSVIIFLYCGLSFTIDEGTVAICFGTRISTQRDLRHARVPRE